MQYLKHPTLRSSDEDLAFGLDSPEPESDFNVGYYLDALRRHWKLLAAICILATSAGFIHYSITPKLYRATATIQIERRSLMPLTGSQSPWLENWWNLEYYPTQYRLLRSRGLAERVVRDLRLDEDPRFNPGSFRLTPKHSGAPTSDDDWLALAHLAEGLRGGLEINPVRDTQLVEISYHSAHPDLVARVANGVAEAFIDWGIETRTMTAGKASTFLASQIESLKHEIQDKEEQLQAYSRSSDIIALDPQSNVTLQRLQALNQDYISAVSQRIEKEARYNELLTAPEESVADTLSDGLVSQMQSEQLKLEREYATKLNTYKPDWPAMVELKAEIDKGQQHLQAVIREMVDRARQTARAEFQTAKRRQEALAAQLQQLKSDALQLNSKAVEYNNLQVEISTRRALLDELLRKQSETEVTSRLQMTRESNVRIVDRALPPGGPYRPSLRHDLSRALLFGLVLGIGCIFLIEFLDRSLKTSEEVERHLALPVLSVVPDLEDPGRSYGGYGYGGSSRSSRRKRSGLLRGTGRLLGRGNGIVPPIELLPHFRPKLPTAETYRALRTALLLSTADELKVVAVTSSQAGEGKTATSINLATVMAQLDLRVLLIDGDLRKPRLHEVFRVSNRVGLVNLLTGRAHPDEIFLPTKVGNLWVTPSGPAPPNPSELLASQRMRELMEMVRNRFDFVVLDTPPVLAVTDATLLGAISDGVVLCLEARKVAREDAREARDRLLRADVRLLGAVLNRQRTRGRGYGKRYQYYDAYVSATGKATDSAA